MTACKKKRIARGAFNRKGTTNRKGCRLPHENLTKKELNKLNGEIKSTKLGDPMSWEAFKELPKDIQEEYIKKITDRFEVGLRPISKVLFGMSEQTLDQYARREGLNLPKKKRGQPTPKANIEGLARWAASKNNTGNNDGSNVPVKNIISCATDQARELLNYHPELRGKDLPYEVFQMSAKPGYTLLKAYDEYVSKIAPESEDTYHAETQYTHCEPAPSPTDGDQNTVRPFRAHDFEDLFKEMDMERETTPTLSGDEEDSENVNFYPLTDLSMTLKGTPIDVIATLRMSFPALLDKDTQYRFNVKVDKYVL